MKTPKYRKYSEDTTDRILGLFGIYLKFLTEPSQSAQWNKFEKLVAVAARVEIPDDPSLARQLQHYAFELVESLDSQTPAIIAIAAIRFGHFLDTLMRVIDLKKLYVGKRSEVGENRSKEKRFGDGSGLRKRNSDMQTVIERLMADDDLGYTAACHTVANNFHLSEKTVQRNTKNPKARKNFRT